MRAVTRTDLHTPVGCVAHDGAMLIEAELEFTIPVEAVGDFCDAAAAHLLTCREQVPGSLDTDEFAQQCALHLAVHFARDAFAGTACTVEPAPAASIKPVDHTMNVMARKAVIPLKLHIGMPKDARIDVVNLLTQEDREDWIDFPDSWLAIIVKPAIADGLASYQLTFLEPCVTSIITPDPPAGS